MSAPFFSSTTSPPSGHLHYHHHHHHQYPVNMSLEQEIALMHDSFYQMGSHCLNVLRFCAQWFFPFLFLASTLLSSSQLAQRVVKNVEEFVVVATSVLCCSFFAGKTEGTTSATSASSQEKAKTKTDDDTKATQNQKNNHKPRHIAVIMDGNRRYGKNVLGSALLGHRAGGEKLREFVRWCRAAEIEMLTVYAFSTENWNRPQHEVDLLMDLFRTFFDQMLLDAADIGIRIRFMSSEPEMLPASIRELMQRVELATRQYGGGICVNVCASYGSRSAVTRAMAEEQRVLFSRKENVDHHDEVLEDDVDGGTRLMKRLAQSFVEKQEEEEESQLVGAALSSPHLYCPRDAELWAAPDMLIRTSGEMRLSNFMLLEMAYAEMFFWNVTWPEVTREMLMGCVDEFCTSRERRLGK